MRKLVLVLFQWLVVSVVYGQIVSLDPAYDTGQEMTLYFDATQGNGELIGSTSVYAHLGIVTDGPNGTAWKNVVGNWGQDDGIGKMEPVTGKPNQWKISFKPNLKSYFGATSNTTIFRLACVFRNADGSKKGTATAGKYAWGEITSNLDFYMDIATNDYVRITSPSTEELFVNVGDKIPLQATSSSNAQELLLFIDEGSGDVMVASGTNTNMVDATYTVEKSISLKIKSIAIFTNNHTDTVQTTLNIIVRRSTDTLPVPQGMKQGVNYHLDDPSKVTLVLLAPHKSFVYVIGDMTDWKVLENYQMHMAPDGETFWLEITDLIPGKDYVYQYFIDGTIKMADPYTEQVADPWNDSAIPSSIFPNLPEYSRKENGLASVLKTDQKEFDWNPKEKNWTRPDINQLIIYELHIRDFLKSHSLKDLADTLSYLQRLGVEAIELMPVNEFEGNDSWGYNPSFYFAVDKYYGTKNDLKNVIQLAHEKGMAVIMDIVLNHAFGQCPLVQMYFDKSTSKPAADNPWFNRNYVGQYQWGYDFNHESSYTQNFVDDVTTFWVEEFHFDGFRFDFTKGFTNYAPNGSVDGYDASRIKILSRMANKIWSVNPSTYVILEHWAPSAEESVLGSLNMKMWRNKTYDMVQASTANNAGSFDGMAIKTHIPLISSHDEQRLAYACLTQGRSSGQYNIKDSLIMLERIKMAAAFTYLQPGPKMIWQFDELGYDVDIDYNGRLGRKPQPWGAGSLGYYEDSLRQYVYEVYRSVLELRKKIGGNTLMQAKTNHKFTGDYRRLVYDTDSLDIVLVANFSVSEVSVSPQFTATGTWYDYFSGDSLNVTSLDQNFTYQAGEWHIFTNIRVASGRPELIRNYQNPVTVDPPKFKGNQKIKILFDATKADPKGSLGLIGVDKVYMQAGVIFKNSGNQNLQHIVGNYNDDGVGKMTKVNDNIWEIELVPNQYFNVGEEQIDKIGVWFRNADNTRFGYGYRGAIVYINVLSNQPIVTISPASFDANTPITIIFDASEGNGELASASKVYMHSGVGLVDTENPQSTAWTHVVGNWGVDNGVGLMTKVSGSDNKWQISFVPKEYYNLTSSDFPYWIAAVFRSSDGSIKGTTTPGEFDGGFVADNLDYFLKNGDPTVQGTDVIVAPNPAKDQIYLLNLQQETDVFLLTIKGEIIEKFTVNALEPISVSNLSHGQYIVVFKQNGNWEARNFLKL